MRKPRSFPARTRSSSAQIPAGRMPARILARNRINCRPLPARHRRRRPAYGGPISRRRKSYEARKDDCMKDFDRYKRRAGRITAAAEESGGGMPDPLLFYVRYVLPLSIVAVPYLWKWILDLEPDSQERIATLEVEAEYNAQWRQIVRDQNEQLIAAYRDGMNSQRVKDAVARLTEKAAIENAIRVVGLIEAPVEQLADQYDQAAGRRPAPAQTSNWRGNSATRSALD